MKPVNPLLPTHRREVPSLSRRTSGLIDAVRSIQQEASADYWYRLALTHGADGEARVLYFAKSEEILRYEIATIRRDLEDTKSQYGYQYYESDGDGGYDGPLFDFDSDSWYEANRVQFDKLFECFKSLVKLTDSSDVKADIWLELAEILRTDKLFRLASECYQESFTCENRLNTLLTERKLYNSGFEHWTSYDFGTILSREQTINKFPHYPDSYYSRGCEKYIEGKYEDAVNDLNLYDSLKGYVDVEFYRLRGRLHYQLGNTSAACLDAAELLRLGGRIGDFSTGNWDDPEELPF